MIDFGKDLDVINTASDKWKKSDNTAKDFTFELLEFGKQKQLTEMVKKKDNCKVSDLVAQLEAVNKLKIPETGEALLKQLAVTEDNFKRMEKTEDAITEVKDDKGDVVTEGKEAKYEEKDDKEMFNLVKKTADKVAKGYDTIVKGLKETTAFAYKDTKVSDDKKKEYASHLSNAETESKINLDAKTMTSMAKKS